MIGVKMVRRYFQVLLLFVAITTSGHSQTSTIDDKESQNVIHQLRIYQIFDTNKKAFHERFRDHAMRIMARYDFKIMAIWETRYIDRTEFVYLLEWPNKETMKDRWTKFMADKEWAEIKKATARVYGTLVGDIEDRTLELTDYSPQRLLTKQN